jgi:hypothetical protein
MIQLSHCAGALTTVCLIARDCAALATIDRTGQGNLTF